jgi:hypothetical protein
MRQITSKLSKLSTKLSEIIALPSKALKAITGNAIVEQITTYIREFLGAYGFSIETLNFQHIMMIVLIVVVAYEIISYIMGLLGFGSGSKGVESSDSDTEVSVTIDEDYCCDYSSEFCFSDCVLE